MLCSGCSVTFQDPAGLFLQPRVIALSMVCSDATICETLSFSYSFSSHLFIDLYRYYVSLALTRSHKLEQDMHLLLLRRYCAGWPVSFKSNAFLFLI